MKLDTAADLERVVGESVEAFKKWREVPAPARGQIVREIADEFRKLKEPLGELVSLEVGKIRAEGIGEVQETIDIADFAVGLSRLDFRGRCCRASGRGTGCSSSGCRWGRSG